jgi:hypothetical protein
MNSPLRPPSDDPLYALPDAARPHYATGMLLDAADFADEQTYHRNRLARALAFASGAGARRLPAGHGPDDRRRQLASSPAAPSPDCACGRRR